MGTTADLHGDTTLLETSWCNEQAKQQGLFRLLVVVATDDGCTVHTSGPFSELRANMSLESPHISQLVTSPEKYGR
jgi:hypothetical protein